MGSVSRAQLLAAVETEVHGHQQELSVGGLHSDHKGTDARQNGGILRISETSLPSLELQTERRGPEQSRSLHSGALETQGLHSDMDVLPSQKTYCRYSVLLLWFVQLLRGGR